MKKIGLLLVVLMFFCGCEKEDVKKTLLEDYGTDYYETFMKDQDYDQYEITLAMLKNTNQLGKTNYDLTAFNDCKSTTSIILTKQSPYEYEYLLECDES